MDLRADGERFAGELSGLLNNTITHGIRLPCILSRDRQMAFVGYKISREELVSPVGIPVTLGAKPPVCYLGLSYRLVPDYRGEHLAVRSSFIGIFLDPELDKPLLHSDYERDKGDGYPEAHIQVCAESEVWNQICRRAGLDPRPLERLHLPVGGRRFRPTLEDIIDCLVTEGIADGHPGWTVRVEHGRADFLDRQLRAAIRRNPETALDQLRVMGMLE